MIFGFLVKDNDTGYFDKKYTTFSAGFHSTANVRMRIWNAFDFITKCYLFFPKYPCESKRPMLLIILTHQVAFLLKYNNIVPSNTNSFMSGQ